MNEKDEVLWDTADQFRAAET